MGTIWSRMKAMVGMKTKQPIDLLLDQFEIQQTPEIELDIEYKDFPERYRYKRKNIKRYRYYCDGTLYRKDTDSPYSVCEIR